MTQTPDFRTPLGRARGLGSAREGVGHWRMQRLTAVALAALGLWFAASWLCLGSASYDSVIHWLSRPIPEALMAFLVIAATVHGALGLQVIVEDYVHCKSAKLALLVGVRLIAAFLVLAGLLAIIRIAASASRVTLVP